MTTRTLLAVLLILGTLGGYSCTNAQSRATDEPVSKPPLTVETVEVAQIFIERRSEVVGSLFPNEQVILSSEVAAPVREVHVDFGSTIRKGQLLVTLDGTEFDLEVKRAENALTEALAGLGRTADQGERAIDIESLPSVAQARVMLEDARTKLSTAASLVATKDIPAQRYVELQKTVESREAALGEARNQAAMQIAAVQARRTEIQVAREPLSDTRIYAPFDGVVAERQVALGQYVRDNTPLLTLVQIDPLRLRARVPESAAAAVRLGMPIEFQTDAHPGMKFQSTVTDVSPVLDPASRTLTAEALVPNRSLVLKPGMFAKIIVVVAEKSPATVVPRSGLMPFAGLTKVFVVRDGKVEEVQVQTGAESGDYVELVNSPLKPGDRVVASNLDELSNGAAVVQK